MTIQFERRTDRPDVAGRCVIHLRAYFAGQRFRYATRERCLASEWNSDKGQFRRSFAGYQEANDYLNTLSERLQAHYRKLLADGKAVTANELKVGLQPAAPAVVALADRPVVLTELYEQYAEALQARGNLAQSMISVRTTLLYLREFEAKRRKQLLLADYDILVHDQLLAFLRERRKLAQNTIFKVVKHLKGFLRYARDERRLTVAVEPREMRIQWADVEKVYLSAAELDKLADAMLPSSLVPTRDAFLFCCYTGLRHSDLLALSEANLHEWNGGKVLRLTQTKTRTAVSIYLTAPALALLDKYAGTRVRLLPATANQVMNRNLKRIANLAGLTGMVEVIQTLGGRVTKQTAPKWELVTMHTARHTFAVQSLLRGLPIAVLQKVLGHAKIQTTMLYAKVVEDFQHQEMQRVWEGQGILPPSTQVSQICAVEPSAA